MDETPQLLNRFPIKTDQSESYFRLLIENAQDIITVLDRRGTILYESPSVLSVLGYRPEELVGRSAFKYIHPADLADVTTILATGLTKPGVPQRCAFRFLDKQKLWRKMESIVCYVHDSFGPRTILNSRDIQQRYDAEQALTRAENDLERARAMLRKNEKLSAMGQVAAGVAHEINNPLGVILGFADILARQVKETDDDFIPVKSIEREAKRCRELVQDLLTFSRESKGGKTGEMPDAVVAGALSLIDAQARMRRIEVRREFESNLPLVEMNRTQIQQVIVNLCTNALDATPGGGVIIVRLSRQDQSLELLVSDNGDGIPKAMQEKVFEPFFTTKPAGEGTGLGLSLVREIVQKHRGSIAVESDGVQGTTFRIRLPLV